jgi:hypothetical protein
MLASRLMLGGRYELAERVGAGGFSEVWRAADLVLARPVAVKLPYPGFAQDDEALARFRAEARNAGRLSHEHVARIYDYGEPDPPNPPFLVMELIAGPPLSALLRDGPLSPDRTARLLAQAATGLAAAHQAGLIHRDIKPGNLMIGPGGSVKITDFGISYAAGSAPLTGTGLVLGTPAYLAPERMTGASATAAGDLYSLGIVGYQCLTGELPFTGDPLQLALAHRDRVLPPLPSPVPAGLAALITALTAKDPAARPASAAEVARQAAALAGRLSAARPGSGRPGAGRPSGTRLPARLPSVPGVSPVPPARTVVPAPRPGRPPAVLADDQPTLRQPAAAPSRARPRAGALAAAALLAPALAGGIFLASQFGPGRIPHAGTTPPASSRPNDPGVRLVGVHRGALIGEPVTVAARQLRRHGLVVRVLWQVSAAQPAGTVLAVRPAGPRPAGSVVTLIGAVAPPPPPPPSPPPGHSDHGHGGGPGPGAGGGPGNGNGGDGGPGNGNGGPGHGHGGPGDGGGNGDGGQSGPGNGDGGDSQA